MSNALGTNYYTPSQGFGNQYYVSPTPQYYQFPTYQSQNYNQNNTGGNLGITWVQGEQQAKLFQVNPGMVMPLFDTEAKTIYLKYLDPQGKPQMTILDYIERDSEVEKIQSKVEYATKEQVEGLSVQFSSINEKLNNIGGYVTKEQFEELNGEISSLNGHIEDIENRLTGFGKQKPQQNYNNTRKGNK